MLPVPVGKERVWSREFLRCPLAGVCEFEVACPNREACTRLVTE